jgi:hypothetical protein
MAHIYVYMTTYIYICIYYYIYMTIYDYIYMTIYIWLYTVYIIIWLYMIIYVYTRVQWDSNWDHHTTLWYFMTLYSGNSCESRAPLGFALKMFRVCIAYIYHSTTIGQKTYTHLSHTYGVPCGNPHVFTIDLPGSMGIHCSVCEGFSKSSLLDHGLTIHPDGNEVPSF